jgi:hypothetical protein
VPQWRAKVEAWLAGWDFEDQRLGSMVPGALRQEGDATTHRDGGR